jgi:ketosteroid isomerase-like protein
MSEQRLREAADKLEIGEMLTRYCRGLDRLDAEMIRSVYHDDAMDHHGPFDKLGKDLAPDLVKMVREGTDNAMHQLSNVSIQLDGDTAWTESYLVTWASHGSNYQDIGARFVDRFERRAGAWKIAERLMILEFIRTTPMGEPSPMLAMFSRGSRDRTDPSYAR